MNEPMRMVDLKGRAGLTMTYNEVSINIRSRYLDGAEQWTASVSLDGREIFSATDSDRAEAVQLAKDFIDTNKRSY